LKRHTISRRNLYHIFGGLIIAIPALFLPGIFIIIFLAVLTFLALSFELVRLRIGAINTWFLGFFHSMAKAGETTSLTGTTYMLMASLASFILFPKNVAALAVAFLAIGDSLAGIVGRSIGKRQILGKTIEGDLTCFFSCAVTGMVFYFAGISIAWPIILIGAFTASLSEAMPIPINDNLTMPLLSGAVMTLMVLFAIF
jgi:acyl phosphate:glycerol-3-phosphate acyltransferase